MYLNTQLGFENFKMRLRSKIFVDKSMIIEILNERVDTDKRFVCITRPRRFGKSQLTYLLESYYSKVVDSAQIFSQLKISETESYENHLNKYNVIKIDFSSVAISDTYEEYIGRVIDFLVDDLEEQYSSVDCKKYTELWDKLDRIYMKTGEKFIFIIDEWDFIFNKEIFQEHQEEFLDFLRNLLKDRAYVALCYMTGILPIKLHSTGSALNMFHEYSFLKDKILDGFCGFTEDEVQVLCASNDGVSYDEMSYWYNGYITASGKRIFNPKSVVEALKNNYCQSYWTNTGAFNEVLEYLRLDITGVAEDVIKMINGESIPIIINREFRAGSSTPQNRKEIYSAMITWGFLSYCNEEIRIPNNELMTEFEIALSEDCFGEVATLIRNSEEMLRATLAKDTKKSSSDSA